MQHTSASNKHGSLTARFAFALLRLHFTLTLSNGACQQITHERAFNRTKTEYNLDSNHEEGMTSPRPNKR